AKRTGNRFEEGVKGIRVVVMKLTGDHDFQAAPVEGQPERRRQQLTKLLVVVPADVTDHPPPLDLQPPPCRCSLLGFRSDRFHSGSPQSTWCSRSPRLILARHERNACRSGFPA